MKIAMLAMLLNIAAHTAALDQSAELRNAVTVDAIREHQRSLQTIADRNRGTRVSGSAGYAASVDYVRERMQQAGYQVTLQEFPLLTTSDHSPPMLRELTQAKKDYLADVDFASMTGVGFSEVEAEIEAVDLLIPSPSPNSSTSGCEKEDFDSFKRGSIALLQRGGCTFQVKADNALKAGARGVIIFNEGCAERTGMISSRLSPSLGNFAVVGASFAVGDALRAGKLTGPAGKRVRMKVDVVLVEQAVHNVIADMAGGDAERIVVIGSHLDSVRSGPGINDNGSGTATNLTIAEKYATLGMVPKNKLRFIWFGAEEFGLVGSEYYVNSLTAQERSKIMAMLNFDMVGSPNYARFVYDGDNSSNVETNGFRGPEGSGYLEKVFLDYFGALTMRSHPTAFDGRSDYGPFIEHGIPAGGLFSGAERRKTAAMAAIYGGTVGMSYDPCYHKACDNFRKYR